MMSFHVWISSTLQSQALLVLPFFTTLPEEPLAELQTALDALVASHFPMQSDEFSKGSLHRNNYMDCIRKVRPSGLMHMRIDGLFLFDRYNCQPDFWFLVAGRPGAFPEPPPPQAACSGSVSRR